MALRLVKFFPVEDLGDVVMEIWNGSALTC